MTRANLEERDLSILKLSLLNMFGNKEQKNIWITYKGRTIKCYACGKNGIIS